MHIVDSSGLKSTYTLNVIIKKKSTFKGVTTEPIANKTVAPKFIPESQTKIDGRELKAYIRKIDTLGKMTLKFNSGLRMDGFNVSNINNTIFNITAHPALSRQNADDYSNESIALTWKALEL